MSLFEAHAVARDVHEAVEKQFPIVKHVMVHVNPTQASDTDAALSSARFVVDRDDKNDRL